MSNDRMLPQECRLRYQPGMACGQTAVCAVTGASPERVLEVLANVAGGPITPMDAVAFQDVLRAIERLGFSILTRNGKPIYADQIARGRREYDPIWLAGRPPIREFLRSNVSEDVLVGHAFAHGGPGLDRTAHSFAVDRGFWVDSSRGEKPSPITAVDPELDRFLVVEYYLVRPSGRQAD